MWPRPCFSAHCPRHWPGREILDLPAALSKDPREMEPQKLKCAMNGVNKEVFLNEFDRTRKAMTQR
jgi:hypothetical protein